ncbi:hypothetical protein KW850_02395 [Bacillus sp. sid0103]|uniref:hypothetical protein n=1 Tax=Bacillus sp. sid0103 TaxID=2856337 RepID=UPI001C47BE66|nr:hypothetical protein [Bacillus sp. sid0103]MBV7504113.1 hypothetical protein [Bacillus sp. sid0103]
MKKWRMLGLLILLITLMTACAKEIPNTNTEKDNVIVLNKETIIGLEKGILVGTPLRLDKKIRLADVEKVWGKYEEMHDHEDIHTYVYTIKNRQVVMDEEELKTLYMFHIEIGITREEILQKMGNPTEGKETGKTLVYQKRIIESPFETSIEKLGI